MKKLLSALLVLVMLLSLPGVGALAASDALTWSLDKKGTLTISGKGEMPDYSGDTPPWEKYRDDIKAVVIEKGVTHIGAQCFQFCTNLKSVSFGEKSQVTQIGDRTRESALPLSTAAKSSVPSITAVRPAIGTKSK